MSTIKLTDNFGLIIDASPGLASVFSKYLKDPSDIVGVLRNPAAISGLEVGKDPFESQSIGISFTEPVTLGSTGVELTINPQLVGTVGISKGKALFDADTDPFRDSISIPPNQAFVSVGLKAELDLGLSGKSGDLQFGFKSGTNVVFTDYRLFALTDQIVPAIKTLFENFVIPGDLEDVESMPQGSVATVEGTGSLKFSAQANLLSVVNPLATVSTAAIKDVLKVQEGGSITVGATYTLTGEYQVRVQRLDGRKFRLGYEKKRSSEFDVSVAAQIGVTASAGGFDLIKGVLQAVSSDAVPDKDAFQKAGLSDDQISTIAAAVKTGIERGLQFSISAELDSLDEVSTAFSYEIDVDALDADGRTAVNDALSGDLTSLESSTPAGVQPIKSIFSALKQGKKILKVNLLGIYNYASVTTLFQKGTIIVDHDSGEITISDQAGANRIEFTSSNFAKNTAKLRRVLAESLLFTAIYKSSATVRVAPQLTSRYWFFELHQRTNLPKIKDYLNIAQALQAVSPAIVTAKLNALTGVSAFGQSMFYADSAYTDPLCRSLFLNSGGQARPQDEYEMIGRMALALLLPAGDPINDARRLPLTDDAIWNQMKAAGQPNNFGGLFASRGFNAIQLADITSDYTLIMWWAPAMHSMGEALARVLRFISQNPHWDPENNTFKKLRTNLEKTMAAVAQNTQSQFGEPWGLLALDLASGQKAVTTVKISCPKLSLEASRTLALATPGV
jgi:hypothetical protein